MDNTVGSPEGEEQQARVAGAQQEATPNEPQQATKEMPKYKCHKEVHALKIKNIITNPNSSVDIFFENEEYLPKNVEDEDLIKRLPHQPGDQGYLVVYKDGYTSWSPTDAFEEGYTLIE